MLMVVGREMSQFPCGGPTRASPSMSQLRLLSASTVCHAKHYAQSKKHAYYDEDFKGTAFEFAALVFETTGGLNEEGLGLLRQLFRFAAKHQGIQLSVYCGRAWARLSCSLQSSVSQCFLNRSGSVAAIEKDIDFVALNF